MALAQRIRHPWGYRAPYSTTTERQDEVVTPAGRTAGMVLSDIVWFVAGVIIALLGLRFVFAALSANPGNGFVNFIYNVSHPFAAPFFGIFHYNDVYVRGTGSHIELYTLLAMLVYTVVAWLLSALVTIGRRY